MNLGRNLCRNNTKSRNASWVGRKNCSQPLEVWWSISGRRNPVTWPKNTGHACTGPEIDNEGTMQRVGNRASKRRQTVKANEDRQLKQTTDLVGEPVLFLSHSLYALPHGRSILFTVYFSRIYEDIRQYRTLRWRSYLKTPSTAASQECALLATRCYYHTRSAKHATRGEIC